MANPTDAYLTRVTAHLATVDRTEQQAFLTRQIARWESLYQAFSRMVDGSDVYTGSATAFEYVTTITALDAMKKERESHAEI